MITNILVPGDKDTPTKQPCDACVENKQAHRIVRMESMVAKPMSEPEYYDNHGNLHTHDFTNSVYTYHCSNGHEWKERFIYKCPTCGWDLDKESAEQHADRIFQGE